MMCCPLTGSDGEGPKVHETAVRRARKEHGCTECGETIAIGVRYEDTTGLWDGQWSGYRTCLTCVEIRDHFACEGWIYGQLWSDLQENFFPDMKMGGPCMAGLSPAAKASLVDARMEWLFDHDEIDDSAWEDWPKNRDRQRPASAHGVIADEHEDFWDRPEVYWPRQLMLEAMEST